MTDLLRRAVFFFGAEPRRVELVPTPAGWQLDGQALRNAELERLGRIEIYGPRAEIDEALLYVAEGLRGKSSRAEIVVSAAQARVTVTLAQPVLYSDEAPFMAELHLTLDGNGQGRFSAGLKKPRLRPDPEPPLFRSSEGVAASARLSLAQSQDWVVIGSSDAGGEVLLLSDADDTAATPAVAWRRTSDGTGDLLRLRGVDLSARAQNLGNRATDVVLLNRAADGALRLSQQLAPRRRAPLSLQQYLSGTAWTLELGPVSVEDFCAIWASALHEPLMAGLARLRGAATSFLPRLAPLRDNLAARGGAYLAFEFAFARAFGEDPPRRRDVVEARLAALRPTEVSAGKSWFRAGMLGGALQAEATLQVRDGALQLALGACDGGRLDLGALSLTPAPVLGARLTLALRSTLGCSVHRGSDEAPPLNLRIEVADLALVRVAPGATDGVPDAARAEAEAPLSASDEEHAALLAARGAGREDTLVIPLAADPAQTPAKLRASEIYAPFRQRRLSLEIRATDRAALQSVLVLDAAPLFVGQLAGIELAAEADVEEIANYSESELEGAKWEIGGIRRAFTLRLPPQALGEAAEKGERFAAIDAAKPIDYRLSAPATLQLQSSWFEQRFNEAPWNLRRVFGYPGQRAPGAGVVGLEFELIYGLQTRFDAQALNHRVQLAELGARVGALPPELDLQNLPATADPRRGIVLGAAQSLVRLRRRYAQRLAQLELYNPAGLPPAGLALPAATADYAVDRGLSFTLRENASMAHPLQPDAHWKLPAGQPGRPAPPYLAGGAVWGFESARVFDEVAARPRSDRGWLRQLRFSALGAYGEQRSVFANGKSSISAAAQMGRLTSYVIERVGRIAGCWNRARHVIEYQRSVLPSAQFVAGQPLHGGRPLLRKLREYVEILEPRRATKSPAQRVPGARFVEHVDFQTRLIPVDGAWGRDLEQGWAIPLWDPLADPAIYPRPQICVECAGSAAEPAVAARVAEPQRLLFYTSTRPEDDENTDAWAPVAGVDYDDLPIPDPRALLAGASAGDYVDGDALLPAEAAEPLGLYRYTLPLEAQVRPSNLVAGTNAARIAARLDNVSLMRAAAVGATAVGANADAGALLLAGISGGNDALARIVNAARATLDLTDPQQRRQRAQQLGDAARQADAALRGRLEKARSWLGRQEASANALLQQARRAVDEGLQQALRRELDQLRRALEAHAGQSRHLAAQLCTLPRVQAKERLREWMLELRQIASGLDGDAATLQQGFAREFERLTHQVETALRQAQRKLQPLGEAMLVLLDDAATDWEERRRRLRAALAEFRARRAALLPQAARLIGYLPKGALRTLLQELAQRLEELEQSVATAEQVLADGLDAAASTPAQVRGRLLALRAALEAPLTTALEPLQQLRKALAARLETIQVGDFQLIRWAEQLEQKLLAATDEAFDSGDAVCARLGPLLAAPFTAALGLVDQAQARLPQLLAPLQGAFDALLAAKAQLAARVDTTLTTATQELQSLLRRLEADAVEAADEIAARLQRLAAPLQGAFGEVERVLSRVREAPSFRAPDETLRLVRALGEGPILPRMSINRDRLAYVFDDYVAAIRTSPAAALVDRVGADLKALGLRVPFDGLGEDLLPPALRQFDLNRLLPDFAGLRCFDGLFGGLKMPNLSEHGIRIRHGFDKEQQSAWLQADLDLTLDQRVEIFSLAGLNLGLRRGRMTGQARLAADLDGLRTERKWAQIKGDWELSFGGYTLVRFVDTPLRLDESGTLRFDVDARKIVLDRALAWLEDVVKKFSDPDSGFTLELLKNDDGMPAGIRAALELPLPPLGGGAVTVAGIILRAFFELEIDKRYPGSAESGFALAAGFGLGKPTQPFSLFIAFLGGGGYLSGSATYWPGLGRGRNFVAQVDLGIAVGAAAAFFVGPLRGHVMVLIGLRASYRVVGKGGRLNVALTLLVTGSASLYGLVTIGLTLYLELIYGADKSLRGDGYISVSVRISRFFKVSYSAPIRYQLAKGSGGSKSDDAYQNAAQARRDTRC